MFQSWEEDMRGMLESSTFAGNAEKVLPFHQDNTAQVKMAVKNIRKCAQEVLQVCYCSCFLSLMWYPFAVGKPLMIDWRWGSFRAGSIGHSSAPGQQRKRVRVSSGARVLFAANRPPNGLTFVVPRCCRGWIHNC